MAGYITGSAAVLDGNNAIQTQSYGSASRGGACKSDVIVSDGDIYELEFHDPDILVSISQEAYNMYADELGPDTILIIDPDLVNIDKKNKNTYEITATEIAYKKFKRKIVSNLVLLGYLTAIAGPVSKKAMQESIKQRVPKGTEKMNLDAFEEGYKLGLKDKKKR
jgi:2-oxoglutarate ferredoxin oxidoreductase subunit gamma